MTESRWLSAHYISLHTLPANPRNLGYRGIAANDARCCARNDEDAPPLLDAIAAAAAAVAAAAGRAAVSRRVWACLPAAADDDVTADDAVLLLPPPGFADDDDDALLLAAKHRTAWSCSAAAWACVRHMHRRQSASIYTAAHGSAWPERTQHNTSSPALAPSGCTQSQHAGRPKLALAVFAHLAGHGAQHEARRMLK